MADSSSDTGRLERIVQALGEVGLEAVIVGAMAAVLRGVPLMTADVDLLVRDTP